VSKAFVKDDDTDAPEFVAPRAPLPPGVVNYVTAEGLRALEAELEALRAERASLDGSEPATDARGALQQLAIRRRELEQRIESAVLVVPEADANGRVRFGADVTVQSGDGRERCYRIVGVDEADAARGKIAFTAPLSRALLGRQQGEFVSVRTPRGDEELEILSVTYAAG